MASGGGEEDDLGGIRRIGGRSEDGSDDGDVGKMAERTKTRKSA